MSRQIAPINASKFLSLGSYFVQRVNLFILIKQSFSMKSEISKHSVRYILWAKLFSIGIRTSSYDFDLKQLMYLNLEFCNLLLQLLKLFKSKYLINNNLT